MIANNFNKNILKIIELFSHDFFIIQQDFNIKCTCIKVGTNQPDPACPRCLGTGHKIKIKKISGACQESSSPSTIRNTTAFVIAKEYYISSSIPIFKDNIIVDDKDVSFVYQNNSYRSFEGELLYQKCSTVIKKLDTKILLKNFYKIVK